MESKKCCDMRGFLSFRILWLLSKKEMYGQEIAEEIAERRGNKPNPGTIYPALKSLEEKGWIDSKEEGRKKIFSLTKEGERVFEVSCQEFCKRFGEIYEEYKETR